MIIKLNRPNIYNVSKGDCLIVPLGTRLERLDITNFNQDFIFASDGIKTTITSYEEAVIKTKRGEYLFGENAEARLLGEGFGGIRIV